MDLDETHQNKYRDKELYMGQKKLKSGLVSRNESNTIRRNHIENKHLKDKIQHIELESSFNFKNIVQSSLNTERTIEKIKVSTGRAFKEEANISRSMDISEINEGIRGILNYC